MSSDSSDRRSDKPVPLRPKTPCPICGKPSVHRYAPFCSLRCADIDLHRWLGGRYAIPAEEPGEDDESQPPAADEDPTKD